MTRQKTDWSAVAGINRMSVEILRRGNRGEVRSFREHGVEWSIAGRYRATRGQHFRDGALDVVVSEARRTWRIQLWTRAVRRGGREVSETTWLTPESPAFETLSQARLEGLGALRAMQKDAA